MRAIKVPPIKIPVVTTQAEAASTADLQRAAAAGAAAAETQATKTVAARGAATAAISREAAAANQLASVTIRLANFEEVGARATGDLATARARMRAIDALVADGKKALALAITAENEVLATNAAEAIFDAEAKQKQAAADLVAAEAANVNTAALSQQSAAAARNAAAQASRSAAIEKGVGATLLATIGARGATLAASSEFLIGAAAATAFVKSLQSFADVEQTLNVFQATTGATADQMERTSQVAKQLGNDISLPGVSAADATKSMLELARAGLTVEQSQAAVRGVLELATAAQIDNAEATSLVANALNAYHLPAAEAATVTDLYANAANNAQGSISDFGQAQAQVSAVANQFGLSIQDTTNILTLAAKAGLRGSDAGTSLRTALLRLGAPTQQARKDLQALNLQIRDLDGNVRPEVFAEFAAATAEMSADVRDAIAAEVFGQDAIRLAVLVGQQGVRGLRDIEQANSRVGTGAELAAAQTKGFAGQLEALKSSSDTAAASLGAVLAPSVEVLLADLQLVPEAVTGASDALSDLASVNIPGLGSLGELLSGIADLQQAIAKTPVNLDDDFAAAKKESQSFAEQVIGGLQDIAAGGADAKKALQGLFGGDDPAAERAAQRTRDRIADLDKLDAARFKAIGTDRRAAESAANLTKQLQAEVAFLNQLGPGATGSGVEAAKQNIDEIVALIGALPVRSREALAAAGPIIAPVLAQDLRASVAELTGFEGLTEKAGIPEAIQNRIKELGKLGPAGKAELRQLGDDLSKALAEGVDDGSNRQAAVNAARKTVHEAVVAAEQEVTESIRSARGNLESLGDTVGESIGRIIEAAPLGGAKKALDDLRESLEKLQEAATRRSLRFDLGQAEADLAKARRAVGTGIGPVSAEQQAGINEFLAPFIEKVADAKAASKEFTLEQQIKDQEDLRDAAAKTAEEGIKKLVGQFESGKINATQFAARINDQLIPVLGKLPKANLGLAFTRDFKREVKTLLDQARDLSGFLGTAGTTPGPQSVNVRDRAKQAQGRVDDARENLKKQLTANEQTVKNTATTNRLLALIAASLKVPNPKVVSALGGATRIGPGGRGA